MQRINRLGRGVKVVVGGTSIEDLFRQNLSKEQKASFDQQTAEYRRKQAAELREDRIRRGVIIPAEERNNG